MKNQSAAVSLTPIANAILGFRAGNILFAAVRLGVFENLERGTASAAKLARRLHLDVRRAEIFFDSLVALDFLTKTSQGYGLTPTSRRFLIPSSPTTFVHNLLYQHELAPRWASLVHCLKSRGRRGALLAQVKSRRFAKEYALGMQELARKSAIEVAEYLAPLSPKFILDVGAGPGSYSRALLEKIPGSVATLMDLPTTIAIAKSLKSENRLDNNRVRMQAHDYRKGHFGTGRYDLVLMSNITHDESEREVRKLFLRAHVALMPGGRIAIHDFVTNRDHTGPLFGALFSVHMLTYTERGKTYSEEEYLRWLRNVGFKIEFIRPVGSGNANESRLIVGRKGKK